LNLDVPSSHQEEPLIPPQRVSSLSQIPEQDSEFSDSIVLYQRIYSSNNEPERVPLDPLNPANPKSFEVDMYASDFQFGMFLRTFLITLLICSGIGILLLIFFCSTNYLANYFKLRIHDSSFMFVCIWTALYFIILILEISNGESGEWKKSVSVDQIFGMMIFSLVSASIEAYCHKKFGELLSKVRLYHESFDETRFSIYNFWRIKDWCKESSVREKQEIDIIQTTISRFNIDMPLYYLSFFEETPKHLIRKVIGRETLPLIQRGNFLFYNITFPDKNIFKGITNFERKIFDYKNCTQPNKYDDKKAYAYSLALDLKLHHKRKPLCVLFLIGIFYTAIFSYRGYLIFSVLSLSNRALSKLFYYLMPYANLCFFVFQGLNIMSSKYFYMEELKELISTERRRLDDGGEKSYPALNILDFKNLEAWMRLRKIFMHLDDGRLNGIVLAMIFVLIIELAILIILGLNAFLKFWDLSKTYVTGQFILAGSQSILYVVVFLILMSYAAKVNAQFKSHRNILLTNKQIAASIFKRYSDFIGEDPVLPTTYIYNEGIKFLKKEYGDNLSPETEIKMEKAERRLAETYDNMLEELNREENQHPVKIAGFTITSSLVKIFGASLTPLLIPLMKQIYQIEIVEEILKQVWIWMKSLFI